LTQTTTRSRKGRGRDVRLGGATHSCYTPRSSPTNGLATGVGGQAGEAWRKGTSQCQIVHRRCPPREAFRSPYQSTHKRSPNPPSEPLSSASAGLTASDHGKWLILTTELQRHAMYLFLCDIIRPRLTFREVGAGMGRWTLSRYRTPWRMRTQKALCLPLASVYQGRGAPKGDNGVGRE
jgi:hypothetical protein